MDRLDYLVTRHLMDKLLSTERLTELLSTLASRRAERAAAVDARLAALECEAANAEDKLKRLYKLVGDGVAEVDDLLKDRIATLRNDRDRTREALADGLTRRSDPVFGRRDGTLPAVPRQI
jgi:hypothetical protein